MSRSLGMTGKIVLAAIVAPMGLILLTRLYDRTDGAQEADVSYIVGALVLDAVFVTLMYLVFWHMVPDLKDWIVGKSQARGATKWSTLVVALLCFAIGVTAFLYTVNPQVYAWITDRAPGLGINDVRAWRRSGYVVLGLVVWAMLILLVLSLSKGSNASIFGRKRKADSMSDTGRVLH